MITLQIILSLALDKILGEPSKWHPLVVFGSVAHYLEDVVRLRFATPRNAFESAPDDIGRSRLAGVACWLLLVLCPTILYALLLANLGALTVGILSTITLYLCIGNRSLGEHCKAIAEPLMAGDLQQARAKLGLIVSRDTSELTRDEIAKGAIESSLENGSDAVLAPVFWFFVAGAPGALCYRLANTLDAMWGYRTARYRDFGWAAARMDDLLNWLPARGCALSYALAGKCRQGLNSWKTQASAWDSPNAGPVIAAGAGALGILVGGAARYNGEIIHRPALGHGRTAEPGDIERAMRLLQVAVCIWVALIALAEAGRYL